jgi:DASH complex subunit DAM1
MSRRSIFRQTGAEHLCEQFEDLAANFDALDRVNESLDAFNEAFASYLYGLKINSYTGVFDQV